MPPEVLLPGMTISRLLPILAICWEILSLAPVPTASIVITAPTPMMIPSMVKAERILLTLRARSDILKVDGMPIIRASDSSLQDKRTTLFQDFESFKPQNADNSGN
jgi:hypothetical protein